ncbi:MAG: hypothetical protein AAF614_35440 [Chloroflexota bacterium]
MKRCIYAYYVLQEIKNGNDSFLDLKALPNGLISYYVNFWRRQQKEDEETWDKIYLPILAMLSASQEPITIETLIRWTGIDRKLIWLRRRLRGEWRPFITILREGDQQKYNFYHATLPELFGGLIDWEEVSELDHSFIEELVDANQTAHDQLINYYFDAWGGQATLADLQTNSKIEDLDNGYGLRYMVSHLKLRCRYEEIHALIIKENDERENLWFKAKERAGKIDEYLSDIIEAWQLTSEDMSSKSLSQKIQYAAIHSSIVSRSDTLLPVFYGEFVKQGVWWEEQVLRYLERINYPDQKSRAIGWIAPYLSSSGLAHALFIARAMLRASRAGIYTYDAYAAAIGYLLPFLPEEEQYRHYDLKYYSASFTGFLKNSTMIVGGLRDEIRNWEVWELFKEILHEVADNYDETNWWQVSWWQDCLDYLARHMSLSTLNQARATIRLRCSPQARKDALFILLPHLARLGKTKAATKLVYQYFEEDKRLQLLAKISRFDIEKPNSTISEKADLVQVASNSCEPENLQKQESLATLDTLLVANDSQQAFKLWREVEKYVEAEDVLDWVDSPHFIWLCNYADANLVREVAYLATKIYKTEMFWDGHLQFPQTKLQIEPSWLLTALSKFRLIEDKEEEFGFLAALSTQLSVNLIYRIFKLYNEITPTSWNIRYFRDLAPNLPEDLQDQASRIMEPYISPPKNSFSQGRFASIAEIGDPANKLVLQLALDELVDINEIDIDEWQEKYSEEERIFLFQRLALTLDVTGLAKLERIIWRLNDDIEIGQTASYIATRYIDLGKHEGAFALLLQVEEKHAWIDPTYNATLLIFRKIAPHLHNEHLIAAAHAACLLQYNEPRCHALRILLPYFLKNCSQAEIYKIFDAPLATLATYPRDEFLSALRELAPIIIHLGEKELSENVAEKIFNTCCWWP